MSGDRRIGLLERPEYKRRWSLTKDNRAWGFAAQRTAALRGWLLDRCERRELWFAEVDGREQPVLRTTGELADALRADTAAVAVAELYVRSVGGTGRDLGEVIAELSADEHVPYLAALRHTAAGLAKRADWEDVWALQRREDAGEDVSIPVPPKYGGTDFRKPGYWRNRGKLDVPKERFISYPGASRDGDRDLLLGWAGFDHAQRAQALATLLVSREQQDGWGRDRLAPLLAALRELLPWVRQWHNEVDPIFADTPSNIYAGFFDATRARLHLTDADLDA